MGKLAGEVVRAGRNAGYARAAVWAVMRRRNDPVKGGNHGLMIDCAAFARRLPE